MIVVAGHAGKLIFGFIGEKKVPVVCMSGRLHSYEGWDIKDTVFPVRVFTLLEAEILLATNAAGGLNSEFNVGDLMLINDHINFPGLGGLHPLKGPNDERFGERFVAMSDAYDEDLRRQFLDTADALEIKRPVHEGTYAFVSGPTFESRAEARFLKSLGADSVGMSTIPECITARHGGLKVLALSLVTNNVVIEKPRASRSKDDGTSLGDGKANHEEVLEAGAQAANDLQKIVEKFLGNL